MGLFDRWSKGEKAGTKRTLALGSYEASRMARRLRSWHADKASINTLLVQGGETLRARARQMCRENPYAANACDVFVAAAVGAGIKPSPLIDDAALRERINAAWLRWTDEADADGLTDFYGMQALAARAMFEGGECFIRFRPRRPEDGLSVPLQLQLLEAEHLPLDDNRDLGSGRVVRAGIEFDAIGRRVAYHFLRSHPGEQLGILVSLDKTVVPAEEVMHLFRPLRPGQIRGQPGITPAMVRLFLLDQYDDAELDRKKTAAMFAGFVTRALGDDAPLPFEMEQDEPVATLQPGMMQVLLPGEDVKFSDPAEVGGSYEAFQFRVLTAVSAALGIPYHSVTGDVSRANYSSARVAQLDFRRRMEQFQHATLVFQFCRPVWQRWIEIAALAGAIPVSAQQFRRMRTDLMRVKWIPPKWEWVDPLKDRQAEKLAVDAGWKSRSDVIEAEGYDPEETDRRIAEDQERERRLGLTIARDADPAPAEPGEPVAQETDAA